MKGLKLTEAQQATLQSELRRNPKVQVYRRAAALLAVHQGRSISQVAGLLGVTRQTVYNWVRTYGKTEQPLSLVDAPRSGRPALWNGDLDRLLEETLRTAPSELGRPGAGWSTGLLQERIASCGGGQVSDETLRRRLRRLGYVWKGGRYILRSKSPAKDVVPATPSRVEQ